MGEEGEVLFGQQCTPEQTSTCTPQALGDNISDSVTGLDRFAYLQRRDMNREEWREARRGEARNMQRFTWVLCDAVSCPPSPGLDNIMRSMLDWVDGDVSRRRPGRQGRQSTWPGKVSSFPALRGAGSAERRDVSPRALNAVAGRNHYPRLRCRERRTRASRTAPIATRASRTASIVALSRFDCHSARS